MDQTKTCEACGARYGRKYGRIQFRASRACSLGCATSLGQRNRKRPTEDARFWAKVDKTPGHGPNGDCWIWTATTQRGGYGSFRVGRKTRKAHRIGFELQVGPVGDNDVLHRCDNPPCVRGAHLFLGDDRVNTKDKMAKGRQRAPLGEKNANARLTEEIVRRIRSDDRCGAEIATTYNVSPATVYAVLHRRTWRHVE